MTHLHRICIAVAVLVTWAWPAHASDDAELVALGKTLSALRAEVDGLSADVEAARAEAREGRLAAARRRTQLEGDLESARLLAAQLEEKRTQLSDKSAARATAADAAKAPVRRVLARLRASVSGGIPYRTRERLARIDDVDRALDAEGPAHAVEALEQVLSAEIDLSRSTERARAPIVVESKRMVADVIRLGTAAMLFRTKAGLSGAAHRLPNGDVEWRPFAAPDDRARADVLFAAFRSATREGVVLVPRPALPPIDDDARAAGRAPPTPSSPPTQAQAAPAEVQP